MLGNTACARKKGQYSKDNIPPVCSFRHDHQSLWEKRVVTFEDQAAFTAAHIEPSRIFRSELLRKFFGGVVVERLKQERK